MARKPRSTKTRRPSGGGGRRTAETAHQRRVRLYLEKHPGASKAQARGHKPKEHATRERRAKAAGRLTEAERAAIRRFAKRQARRMDADPSEVAAEMIAWAQEKGMGSIDALRDQVGRLNKRQSNFKIRRRKGVVRFTGSSVGRSRNLADMDAFTDRYNLPDPRWLYYK